MSKDMLYTSAVLGEQIDSFYRSDIGQYLLTKVNDELLSAFEELKTVDPHDPSAIMKAQNSVWRAEQFTSWLEEGIINGLKSKDILEDRGEA